MLSQILRETASTSNARYTLIALSYRGYWTSSGRASQAGIARDADSFLDWLHTVYLDRSEPRPELVIWGQSIGAGVATLAAASYLQDQSYANKPMLSRILLETPFHSIRSMLVTLYPQKWLPYRYLWPFLWNWWDSEHALRRIAQASQPPKILLVPAERDEIVPREQSDQLENVCKELKLDVQRKDVVGALHQDASFLPAGRKAIVQFLQEAGKP